MDNNLHLKGTNGWALICFALIGFILGYGTNEVINFTSAAPTLAANNPTPTPTPTPPAAKKPNAIPVANAATADDDAFLGEEDAPVTIIEFTDYQCPFCSRHFTNTFPEIKKEYIDTGKVKYVLRDYPLGFHQFAQKASEATECAEDQDKFWEMHAKVFENNKSLTAESFSKFAADLGLDTSKFDECLNSDKYAEEVKKDMAEGSASGITGTPGFFVNDKKVTGAQPFASFKAIIEEELK